MTDELAKRTSGQELFAAIVDELATPLPPSLISIAVKHGKQSLAAGVEPRVVLLGCVISIRRGSPELAARIIGDIALAESGLSINPSEYRRELASLHTNATLRRIENAYRETP